MNDRPRPARYELDDINLDPSAEQDPDPESWEEQPTTDGDARRYDAERPPHHGD